jgi:acetyl-CoA acetyltransferase
VSTAAHHPFRGRVAAVGIGETPYYKRGSSPDAERKLCLKAIVSACEEAGIDPRDVDGFSSYGADENEAPRLTAGLGTREVRWSTLIWGGGGGGSAGALVAAASAIITGQAETVVVYRASAESSSGRLLNKVSEGYFGLNYLAHAMDSPAQALALYSQRQIEHDGVAPSAFRALALASYYHAQNNPRAVAYGRPLDAATYDHSRMVAEPYRLFDCSRENDAAAAVVLTSAERAADLVDKPAYLLGAAFGSGPRWGELDGNHDPLTSGGFREVAARVWKQSSYGPTDVDVAQIYLNFTGPGVAALIDHGFCTAAETAEKLIFENLIAPAGWLPVNTSGGDIAEGFVHGMGNTLEAIRQIRGDSPNQVPDAHLSLLTGGPMAELVSSALFGSVDTL